jgi:putative ABC transport system permease protein
MLTNILKSAIRNITSRPGYTLLNVLGMTIAITASLFLIMYVFHELSYDRYHDNIERIYRVQSYVQEPDDEFTWIIAQIPFTPQVVRDYPEVEKATRLFNMGRSLFRYNEEEHNEEGVYYADSSFFEIFTYSLLDGALDGSLNRPNSIVLTKTMAERYFGNESPIGKSLQSGDDLYTVTAVIEDVPENSHILFDGLVSRSTLPDELGSWGQFGVFTYLLLREDTDVSFLEDKMKSMYDNYMASIFESIGINITYQLVPVKDIHLHSDSPQEPRPTGSILYVTIFGVVAFFLLLIAVLNYVNLSTARSAKRAKEISLRKVVGSDRASLIWQFQLESVFLTLVSILLGVVLIIILLPWLNTLSGKSFELNNLLSPVFLLSLAGIIIVVGLIGGLYPSFYLSRFSPVEVMKGTALSGNSKGLFRKVLTVVQFTISCAMIASTILVLKQLNYMQNMDQGWNMDNVVALILPDNEPLSKMRLMKERLADNPEIINSTLTNVQMGDGSPKAIFSVETDEGMTQRGINMVVVDHDFYETLGIEVLEGRDFTRDLIGDTISGVMVNETLANRLGWEDPIGKRVQLGDGGQINGTVVGMVKDYHQTGMYNAVESLLFLYRLDNPIMYVKLNANNVHAGIDALATIWGEVFPGKEFEYTFLSDNFLEQFGSDRNRSTIFFVFTILIIIIACLGLFGLASFTVERRTREIGVRKVFGATENRVLAMISYEFLILMVIALLIATPLVIIMMREWLQDYVYRIRIGPMVFIWTVLITLLSTAVTITYQALKAARTNPAKALRME